MKKALPYLRFMLLLFLYFYLNRSVLHPLDGATLSGIDNEIIFINQCLGVMVILSGSLLLFKKTLWIGAWMSLLLAIFSFVSILYANEFKVLHGNNNHHFLGFLIWLFGLLILWNERKNIPFIN